MQHETVTKIVNHNGIELEIVLKYSDFRNVTTVSIYKDAGKNFLGIRKKERVHFQSYNTNSWLDENKDDAFVDIVEDALFDYNEKVEKENLQLEAVEKLKNWNAGK